MNRQGTENKANELLRAIGKSGFPKDRIDQLIAMNLKDKVTAIAILAHFAGQDDLKGAALELIPHC